MPLIKRDAAPSPASAGEPDLAGLTAALTNSDADTRWAAARALGGRAQAVPALAAALATEGVPQVREAIMTALIRVGDEASVMALMPYLRSPDAARRGAAIEALQALPQATAPFMAALLADGDSDVRILAMEIVRGIPGPEAVRLLCGVLEHEQHANVCAAAIDVLAEVGTRDALPALEACAIRFAGTPFLPFAVSIAVARIADAEG